MEFPKGKPYSRGVGGLWKPLSSFPSPKSPTRPTNHAARAPVHSGEPAQGSPPPGPRRFLPSPLLPLSVAVLPYLLRAASQPTPRPSVADTVQVASPKPPGSPCSAGQDQLLMSSFVMDPNMKQLQEALVDIETDAEKLLLGRHQLVENDKMRNANREALTALRKRARTTKTSVPSPFQVIMKEMEGTSGKQLVKEICSTCGNHDPKEHIWLMFPGSDIFARVPFHVAHSVLDKDQELLDYDTKKLQSFVKEKSFVISEKGALADRISPGIVKSLVSLTDKPK